MLHDLKTWPKYFRRIFEGDKTCEIRRHDRDFAIGDVLCLKEYDPDTKDYTGRQLMARVSHIVEGGQFGIESGYCLMSIKIVS